MAERASGCLLGTNCCVTVPQDKYYVVEKFGKFDSVLEPGLAFAGLDLCGCCIAYRSITSRQEQTEVHVSTKTSDNVFLKVLVQVQRRVIPAQAREAIYRLSNVDEQIHSYVADVVRSTLPRLTLDEAFAKKDDISSACKERLTANMAAFGVEIIRALVTDLKPDGGVMEAMEEISKQRRLRDAAAMSAEADKIRVVRKAEGEADAMSLQGQGIARQRGAIIKGLMDSIQAGTDEKLDNDTVAELLLLTQYFETLKAIGTHCQASTLFMKSGLNAVGEVSKQVHGGPDAPGQAHMAL